MIEVESSEFDDTVAALRRHLSEAVHRFAKTHGLTFEPSRMSQSSIDARASAVDLLTFGCDYWPGDPLPSPAVTDDSSSNVVAFKPRRGRARRVRRVFTDVASAVGAVVGTTLIAAACTESVDFPGLPTIAERIYSKNLPPQVERIVDIGGRWHRVVLKPERGERGLVQHVLSSTPLTMTEAADMKLPVSTSAMSQGL